MGTAPDPEQHLAMPTPMRVVSRSQRLLVRLGMPQELALATILEVAARVRSSLSAVGESDLQWVDALIVCAADRLTVLNESHRDYLESEYANGTGSTTAGTTDGRTGTPQG